MIQKLYLVITLYNNMVLASNDLKKYPYHLEINNLKKYQFIKVMMVFAIKKIVRLIHNTPLPLRVHLLYFIEI